MGRPKVVVIAGNEDGVMLKNGCLEGSYKLYAPGVAQKQSLMLVEPIFDVYPGLHG